MKPRFFSTPSAFRNWLEEHHDGAGELLVGFHKRGSGRPSITWPESVDQALCFGWIDGVRKSIDDVSYTIRFTPRKQRSVWSAVNVKRATELERLGLMHPAGLEAFRARSAERSGRYSYEQRNSATLGDVYEKKLRANKKALSYFRSQAAWYQRAATWWVVSAKKEETRMRRLATLIDDSANGRTIAPLTRPVRRT
jgi:uncharacterized protein YdeI (YjbR/CyaY-like superfamily)